MELKRVDGLVSQIAGSNSCVAICATRPRLLSSGMSTGTLSWRMKEASFVDGTGGSGS